MTTIGETSKAQREALVEALALRGAIRTCAVRDAFATIPREAFVPFFYQEQGHGWIPRTSTDFPEQEWLKTVYTDESLVTKLSTRNAPISSSSMPSVMARMLEALQVAPGMRVLEIGTGSGYNAALLATLAGNPACITTVEVDEQLAQQAQQALSNIVGTVQVQVGDGWKGASGGKVAHFDRIVATASCRSFPWAWYHQLAPGGRLVMDLQGKLGVSSFCILVKSPNGVNAQGFFQSPPLYFMPMQEEIVLPPPGASSPPTIWKLSAENPLPHRLQGDAFRWFVQWRFPGLSGSQGVILRPSTRERVAFLRFRDQMGTRLDLEQRAQNKWSMQCVGSTALWESLEQASVEWDELEHPSQQAYHLEILHDKAAFLVAGKRLPL